MLLSGELLSTAGRSIGLDSVQVSRGLGGAASTFDLLATDSDPEARLTLAKNLSREVELIFSQSLRETGDITWIATYRPIRQIEFRGTTDDGNNQTYEFRHELRFGGGAPAPPDTRAQANQPYVAAIGIQGDIGFSENEIRRRLRLDAGDRFDYYRWLQDRDRVLAFYHDRDYLEARLSARREPAGDGRVILAYDIRRGPRTALAVEGYGLSSGLIGRMKTEWSQAVFDGFLIDDLETMARQELVAARHLQAAIDVTIEESPETDTKTIRVRISPGPRFDEPRIEFNGNTRVDDDALEAAVRARGLAETAWLNPGDVASAVQDHYRSLGYLSVEVTPRDPVFRGTAATLPFEIEEGEAFTIGAVDVNGPSARPVEEVRSLAALQPGTAYRPGDVEPARRRIEVDYLQRGYNHARVSAAVVVDREQARADVVLTVVEGPQQILASVEVTGDDATSRRTIDRALKLEPGAPVDLSHFYGAQKRLYDTGVFQLVDINVEPVEGAEANAATQPVRASVVLQELPRYRFRYGFRVTDRVSLSDLAPAAEGARQVQPAIVADLLNRNVFGRAISAGVAGQLERDRRLARGIFSLPSLFGLPVVTNLFLTQSRQDLPRLTEVDPIVFEDTSNITVEQRFRPSTRMAVSYGYSFERKHTFEPDPDPDSILPIDLRANVARLTGTYAWDTRDDPSNATRGFFHSSGFEFGPPVLGSHVRFIRYLAQQYYFRGVGEHTVLASAFRLGMGRGFDQDLIATEKFYAGGSSTVRGFGEQSLGEAGFFGPAGGNSLIVLNQEIRFPMYRWVRGAAFLDAGNVFPTIRDLSFTNLEVGTGFGVRVESPFALIRVDFGVPLTNRANQPRARWYFAIGHTF